MEVMEIWVHCIKKNMMIPEKAKPNRWVKYIEYEITMGMCIRQLSLYGCILILVIFITLPLVITTMSGDAMNEINGKVLIPMTPLMNDSQFSTNSYYKPFEPRLARFNSLFAWGPIDESPGSYLQVDLGDVYRVAGVATKGQAFGDDKDEWVSYYRIGFSTNGTHYEYLEGEVRGNVDAITDAYTEHPVLPSLCDSTQPIGYCGRRYALRCTSLIHQGQCSNQHSYFLRILPLAYLPQM